MSESESFNGRIGKTTEILWSFTGLLEASLFA